MAWFIGLDTRYWMLDEKVKEEASNLFFNAYKLVFTVTRFKYYA